MGRRTDGENCERVHGSYRPAMRDRRRDFALPAGGGAEKWAEEKADPPVLYGLLTAADVAVLEARRARFGAAGCFAGAEDERGAA